MSSRPLFMSVAESIVILPPICQVGWASASSIVTSSSCSRVRPAKRTARRREHEPVDGAGALAGDQLVQRGVLGVDGQDLGARGLGERHHELAADDERLLVGEREIDALAERRDRRAEPGRADEGVQDEVGGGLHDEPHETLGPGEHLAVGPRLGRARGGVGIGEGDAIDAMLARLRDERLPRALGRQPDELEVVGALEDLERLGSDRAGRPQDEQAAGHRRRG